MSSKLSTIITSESTVATSSGKFSVEFFDFLIRRDLSLKVWMMSASGIRPGILLQEFKSVAARVDSSDRLCRRLLTVRPPCEKARSTSQEDANKRWVQATSRSFKKLHTWCRHEISSHTSQRRVCHIGPPSERILYISYRRNLEILLQFI